MGCGASSLRSAPSSSISATVPGTPRLTKTPNYTHGGNITQQFLVAQRAEFWNTRTEGSPITWATLRTACEAVLDNDMVLAEAVLKAANITLLSDSLALTMDELGREYSVPVFCLANPVELVGPPGSTLVGVGTTSVESSSVRVTDADSVSASVVRTVGVSGAAEGPPISVHVKINPGDVNLTVQANSAGTVADLKRVVSKEQSKVNANITPPFQRLFLLGKPLSDDLALSALNIDGGNKIIQVFLRPDPNWSSGQ